MMVKCVYPQGFARQRNIFQQHDHAMLQQYSEDQLAKQQLTCRSHFNTVRI